MSSRAKKRPAGGNSSAKKSPAVGNVTKEKPGPKPLNSKRWEAQVSPQLWEDLDIFMAPRRLPTTTKGEILAYLLDIAKSHANCVRGGSTSTSRPMDYGSGGEPQTDGRIGGEKRRRLDDGQERPANGGGFTVEEAVRRHQLHVVRGGGRLAVTARSRGILTLMTSRRASQNGTTMTQWTKSRRRRRSFL
jgi:hypothetical protein